MSSFVSGLVLAAGSSSRLEKHTKQLLPWRGSTLLGWVIAQSEISPLDEVVVVVGHQAEEVRSSVALKRARFVEAPDFRQGCTASIRAGLEGLDPRAKAAVLILGDQPEIESDTIAALIGRWRKSQTPVVRVSYRGRSGHPMLFSKGLFGKLKELHGDKGVWKLLEANREWVQELEVDKPYPGNVNTWDDYTKLTSVLPA